VISPPSGDPGDHLELRLDRVGTGSRGAGGLRAGNKYKGYQPIDKTVFRNNRTTRLVSDPSY